MAAHCTLNIICIIAQTFQVGKSSKTKFFSCLCRLCLGLLLHNKTIELIERLSVPSDSNVGEPGESKELFFSTLIPVGMEDSQELESALRLMKLNGGYAMIMHCLSNEHKRNEHF